MGFRLDISCKENPEVGYYGTKLFGYVDETKLLSWEFLRKNGKLDELIKLNDLEVPSPEYIWWGGCFIKPISLSAEEFSEFIILYACDLRNQYDDDCACYFLNEIHPVLTTPGDKLISWG